MTKKKSIISKLFVALVALTLISCCFLGSTFARYTSSGTGSGSAEVANWKINIYGDGVSQDSAQVLVNDLAPSAEVFTGTNSPRSNPSDPIKVATISNGGEVNATVTITMDDMKLYKLQEDGTTASTEELTEFGTHQKTDVEGLFSYQLYYTTTDSFAATNGITSGSAIGTALAPNQAFYIWAVVTWTSADATSKNSGVDADELDTWVGQNLGAIGWNLSYVAVQAA